MSSSSTPLPTATARQRRPGRRIVSITYLGLTRERAAAGEREPGWQSWYRYFPWEDWRGGPPTLLARAIAAAARRVGRRGARRRGKRERRQRGRRSHFGLTAAPGTRSWCCSATSCSTRRGWCRRRDGRAGPSPIRCPGEPMRYDHRRILATGIARLRAKIKYRPGRVRADAAATSRCCSCSARSRRWPGVRLHKQNFRRLIEQQGLVEETGADRPRNRRPAGQALPLPPRGPARARRRRHQAARSPARDRLDGKPRLDSPHAQRR